MVRLLPVKLLNTAQAAVAVYMNLGLTAIATDPTTSFLTSTGRVLRYFFTVLIVAKIPSIALTTRENCARTARDAARFNIL